MARLRSRLRVTGSGLPLPMPRPGDLLAAARLAWSALVAAHDATPVAANHLQAFERVIR
jgi:hypothetical protein